MANEAGVAHYVFPSENYPVALRRAAEAHGVQEVYWDIWGKEHKPDIEVQKAVLASMGVNVSSADTIDQSLRDWLRRERLALLPSCVVSSDADAWLPVTLPPGAGGSVTVTVALENGSALSAERRLAQVKSVEFDGLTWSRGRIPLPEGLPHGYHKATVAASGLTATCELVHCPDKVYDTGNHRMAGIAISLYGLRSNRNWGCGDFNDLQRFSAWAAKEAEASFVALNPLHALANRSPFNTSPYLPASTYYRNFIYLDIEAIPEFQHSPLVQRLRAKADNRIAELRALEFVDYEGVARLKRFFLQLLYRQFLRGGAARRSEFDAFRRKEGRLLERFAVYSALDERLHRLDANVWIWPHWPAEYQDPDSPEVADFARREWRRVEFWQFVYWLVDRQVEQAQARAVAAGMPIGLYHDLALATDRCGSDLWAYRPYFANGCRVGAPPDDFSPKGQDWSFPPPAVERHRADGYRLFAAAIRNNSRHGGALRIDHVMRFFRLYWIPEGKDATEGTYVREPWRDLLRIVALESHRNRVMVIGEDLGTVEDYVREGLAEIGVLSYRLLYFEKTDEGKFKRPDEYPAGAVVSSTTHDLPTLAGYWLGRDVDARRNAGLLPDEDSYRDQMRARLEDKHKMVEILHDLQLLPPGYPRDAAMSPELTGELHNAAIGFLASANSRLFVLNQEDLTKETEQQNLPGSTWEYPNWRRKMRYSIEELESDAHVKDFTRMLRKWLERTGRVG
ncbi:MAG: 4-alpha-glucanotransferase [Acidobacteria bacterium]|nr:4-alpha-glucanotransferase [Acidobacteriota bacterium]